MNPTTIATEIVGNCEAYDVGIINRARWDAEQRRLWKSAADVGLASVVLTLILRTSATGPGSGHPSLAQTVQFDQDLPRNTDIP